MDLTGASWNRVIEWVRRVEALKRSAEHCGSSDYECPERLTLTALHQPVVELGSEGGFVRQFLLEDRGHGRRHRLRYWRMDEHVLPAHRAQDEVREPVDPPRLDRFAVRRRRPGRRR